MKVLALETMGRLGSVAALEGGVVLAEQHLDAGLRSAQSITPAIDAMLKQLEWPPHAIELVAVTTGPGSFTGLRIGVTTAKVLAYAVGAEVIGVDALEVIATQTSSTVKHVHVAVSAERQQFFSRSYTRKADGNFTADEPLRIVSMDTWVTERTTGDVVIGSGLAKVADRLPGDVIVADQNDWNARAATVGIVGHDHYQQGDRDDPWTLLPNYGRRSAAEEKADRKDDTVTPT